MIFASCLATAARSIFAANADYLVTFPPGAQNTEIQYTLQLSLPGRRMPATLDQSNWRFAAGHHQFILVNFEVDYDTFKSSADVENSYQRILSAVQDIRARGYRIPDDRLILTGTSMGGSLALSLALHHPETFRRVGIVSGAWPAFWVDYLAGRSKGLHFYIVHGQDDQIIKLELVQRTIDRLMKSGATVRSEIIDHAGHNLNSAAYAKVLDWIATDMSNESRSK
jgi:predicted esterase